MKMKKCSFSNTEEFFNNILVTGFNLIDVKDSYIR